MPAGYHLVRLADGSYALVNDATGNVAITDPYTGAITGEGGPIGDQPTWSGDGGGGTTTTIQAGGTPAFLPAAMKWLGALALLWIVLTALTEYSPNTRQLGIGLAGLILVGALYYLGPTAIANVKHLWE